MTKTLTHVDVLARVSKGTGRDRWAITPPNPRMMIGGRAACECGEVFPNVDAYEKHYQAAINEYSTIYYRLSAYRARRALKIEQRRVERNALVLEAAKELIQVGKHLIKGGAVMDTTAWTKLEKEIADLGMAREFYPNMGRPEPINEGDSIDELTGGEW